MRARTAIAIDPVTVRVAVASPNEILIRRANRILLPGSDQGPESKSVTRAIVATCNLNLQTYGYTMEPAALHALCVYEPGAAIAFLSDLVNVVRQLRGADYLYSPMYPNFPRQVMDASSAELYLNAILHYFSAAVADVTGMDCVWLPTYDKDPRRPLDEKVSLTVLRVGRLSDLSTIATRLATSNTSLSDADKQDLAALVAHGLLDAPETIPSRENAALVGALLSTPRYVRTATDVLRLAAAMSGGDISLAGTTVFRKFTRAERRMLLWALEGAGDSRLEDMQRWTGRWLRLGEKLHPGEPRNRRRFPGVAVDFAALRSGLRAETFNARLERLLFEGDVRAAVDLAVQRPGELARRLDYLLRLRMPGSVVARAFESVAGKVSTPVLLQVGAHFNSRGKAAVDGKALARVVFPKGSVSKARSLPPLPVDGDFGQMLINYVLIEKICEETLIERFRGLPPLGKVYVDPELGNYLLPFSQRSASASLRTAVRGSRIPFGVDNAEKSTVRFFVWWRNMLDGSRVDVDLSAVLYGADWNYMEHIAYTNLRSTGYKAAHSGDITDAPNGACEFIDIDIPSALRHDVRYVIMVVNSFTSQPFSSIPECSAGWMLRERPQSGEIFAAPTVVDRIAITSQAMLIMPMVLDLVERRVIWVDTAIKSRSLWGGGWGLGGNIHSNADRIQTVGRAFTQIFRPTLGGLLRLHGLARGTIVDSPDGADTVFMAGGIEYDLARIASEFMVDPPRAADALTARTASPASQPSC